MGVDPDPRSVVRAARLVIAIAGWAQATGEKGTPPQENGNSESRVVCCCCIQDVVLQSVRRVTLAGVVVSSVSVGMRTRCVTATVDSVPLDVLSHAGA